MRQLYMLVLALILINNSFSQKIDNDTLYMKQAVKTPWGIKIELGGLLHQKLNQDYIDNIIVQNLGFSVYYKQLSFIYDAFVLGFSPEVDMKFDNIVFNSTVELGSFNLNMSLGYNLNFHKNWSSDFKVGINITSFEIMNPEEVYQNYKSNKISGAILGVGLDRYFKLKGFKYIVLSLGADYYSTNYNSISSDLSRSSMNYSLTIGYKFWVSKKIEN